MEKILISLYDYTGNWSRPFSALGWDVVQVDIQHGIDVFNFNYQMFSGAYCGLLIAQPCDNYALSGARHFRDKDLDGRTAESQLLVKQSKKIIDYLSTVSVLKFWCLENPMSRIHSLNPWLGPPVLKFNPCDYAGYDPLPDESRYNKATWLWGRFNLPEKKYIAPICRENPGWKKFGGKSLNTKNERSKTPLGFANAFAAANG